MAEIGQLNLIRVFGFYLAAMFVISTYRRLAQYRDVTELVVRAPGRWPNLCRVITQHRRMFLTWATLRPALWALLVTVLYMFASRVIWPQANLTFVQLRTEWFMWPVLLALGGAMLTVDLLGIIRVAAFDQASIEKYLDEAEHWLTSWKAPLVSIVTFGAIRPRRIVDTEVRKALDMGKDLLHRTLWWMTMQVGLRTIFGLALWTAWILRAELDLPPS
ncbi:hypothetical protein [Tuwongella immobilis]|uniref:Uncharacterized protein n=1 Tax=Tuwongella immobilis TaxID=692036 RepID=A0A6C2YP27_9BACT|nr:hypothetical protein [Tuwongella immobilis]VIP02949.1 unnamed protein product [Tuwongella immobilis]VTS02935.1 unnamed protein product [Tuwongella immobilis]